MRWFPFSSFTVSPIALHISDHTCAVLRLNAKNEIVSFGRAPLPQGVMEGGLVRDRKQLGERIREACARALPKPIKLDEEVPVIFSIPESQSFTHLFTVPSSLPDEQVAQTIQKKAEEIIPAPLDSLYTDWHIAEENVGGNDRILFAAAPREIIEAYITVCEEINLLPLAIDMETVSLARALLAPDGKASMIIDIGSRTTTLGFFDEAHRLGLSLSIPIAGNNFTRALIDRLHVSFEDAEELKRSSGLSRALADNRSMVILQEQLQLILAQIRKATSYFESTYHKTVTKIVLAGGDSLIPDMVVYISMNLKNDVVLGNPLAQLSATAEKILGGQESVLYAPLVGLSLRARSKDPENEGINLLHGWEGEKWEEREAKILRQWRKLALPLFVVSTILFAYVVYAYVYLPYMGLREQNISRIAPASNTSVSTSTDEAVMPSDAGTTTNTIESVPPTELVRSVDEATTTTEDVATETRIRVQSTPTGWLNVRSGPAATFAISAKILPGEEYVVLGQENDWIHLDLEGRGDGWVSAVYVKEISNESL